MCIRDRFGHSDIDPADYRSDEEVRQWMETDPIPRYEEYLRGKGLLDAGDLKEIRERARSEVEEAIDFAEKSARPEPKAYLDHVYAEDYPGFEIEGRPGSVPESGGEESGGEEE